MRSLLVIIAILCGLGVAWGEDDPLTIKSIEPVHYITFSNAEGKIVGTLSFKDKFYFEGDVDESAKMFF